jgi:hypothetical protein
MHRILALALALATAAGAASAAENIGLLATHGPSQMHSPIMLRNSGAQVHLAAQRCRGAHGRATRCGHASKGRVGAPVHGGWNVQTNER